MKLKKCKKCDVYTLKNNCPKCNEKTSEGHYKFIRRKAIDEKVNNIKVT